MGWVKLGFFYRLEGNEFLGFVKEDSMEWNSMKEISFQGWGFLFWGGIRFLLCPFSSSSIWRDFDVWGFWK